MVPLLGQSMSFYSKLSFQDAGKKALKTEKAVAASGPTVSSLSSLDNMTTHENVADSSMCSDDPRWLLFFCIHLDTFVTLGDLLRVLFLFAFLFSCFIVFLASLVRLFVDLGVFGA